MFNVYCILGDGFCGGKPDGKYPHPKCDMYYQCQGGQTIVMTCAPGTHFNPDNGICDWPFNIISTSCE